MTTRLYISLPARLFLTVPADWDTATIAQQCADALVALDWQARTLESIDGGALRTGTQAIGVWTDALTADAVVISGPVAS